MVKELSKLCHPSIPDTPHPILILMSLAFVSGMESMIVRLVDDFSDESITRLQYDYFHSLRVGECV